MPVCRLVSPIILPTCSSHLKGAFLGPPPVPVACCFALLKSVLRSYHFCFTFCISLCMSSFPGWKVSFIVAVICSQVCGKKKRLKKHMFHHLSQFFKFFYHQWGVIIITISSIDVMTWLDQRSSGFLSQPARCRVVLRFHWFAILSEIFQLDHKMCCTNFNIWGGTK